MSSPTSTVRQLGQYWRAAPLKVKFMLSIGSLVTAAAIALTALATAPLELD